MRLTAIAILAEWGTEAKTAVPSLRKLLVDDDRMIRAFSGRALVSIELDKDEIPGILATMRLGDNENADFEKWTKDFFDSQAETRKLVRDAGAEFVLAAVRQLEHGNPFYQRRAMRMLGVIGPASKVAIPAIIKAASSDDEATRATAMETLTQIDPSAVPLKLRRNARK